MNQNYVNGNSENYQVVKHNGTKSLDTAYPMDMQNSVEKSKYDDIAKSYSLSELRGFFRERLEVKLEEFSSCKKEDLARIKRELELNLIKINNDFKKRFFFNKDISIELNNNLDDLVKKATAFYSKIESYKDYPERTKEKLLKIASKELDSILDTTLLSLDTEMF